MALRFESLRDTTEGRTLAAPADGSPVAAASAVVLALSVAWTVTYLTGGTKTAAPHLFYVPVVVAAVRFRWRGALLTAVVAGLAAGPAMPLDVARGAAQHAPNWIARMGILMGIGQLTAYLHRHSMPSLSGELANRRFRREMAAALAENHIGLRYQPIVDLRTGELAGVEALIRYEHPDRGLQPTDQFVAAAERAGCIDRLTRFVLHEACGQGASWHRSSLATRDRFIVAVNVSGQDLAGSSIVDDVTDALDATGLPSSWLHLEVTETALVGDVKTATATVNELRRNGVRLAVDDFGTGESSLGYLDLFSFDALKIDRIFVNRLSQSSHADALTHGIVAMATALGMEVVAEGVETEAQAVAVRSLGCRYAQGYLWAPALVPAEIELLLADATRLWRHEQIGWSLHDLAWGAREGKQMQGSEQWHLDAFASTMEALVPARQRFEAWLDSIGVRSEDAEDLVVVLSELGANAVEAATDPDTEIEVRVWCEGAALVLEVENQHNPGAGGLVFHTDSDPLRGFGQGLLIVTAYTDSVEVVPPHADGGLVVRCRKEL